MPERCSCFLKCGNGADVLGKSIDALKLRCNVCGTYRISGTLAAIIENPEYDGIRPYLSAHTRQADRLGAEEATLLTEFNFRTLADSHRSVSMASKARRLLEILQKQSDFAGQSAFFRVESDYPLIDTRNPAEAHFFVRHAIASGFIEGEINSGRFQITPKGWQELMPAQSGGIPRTCFVAMSFDDGLAPAFDEGISLAVTDCGFRVVRVDRVHHNENINDTIMAEIRGCQIMVADFTNHRPGVYFEAGFALGLGRIVIWTCHEDDFNKAHFDTRPYNHILWSAPAELRQKLTARIRATVPFARLDGEA